jgi:hypothetical protein
MCVVLVGVMLFSGSASAITIDALSVAELGNLVPADMVGDGFDPPLIANGAQGISGVPFFADANGVIGDDDDPIVVGDTFDILLGPATGNEAPNFPNIDIDALLITVTFDVSGGQPLLPVTLSEGLDSDTLALADFGVLSTLGFVSGGGGDSFNPADDDRVGAFLLTGVDFNAGTHTDIGDYILTVAGWSDDYWNPSLYRIDLFGVDLDYNGGEIVSSGPNSSGGFLVPEPGSFAIIGSLLLGMAAKRRTTSARR